MFVRKKKYDELAKRLKNEELTVDDKMIEISHLKGVISGLNKAIKTAGLTAVIESDYVTGYEVIHITQTVHLQTVLKWPRHEQEKLFEEIRVRACNMASEVLVSYIKDTIRGEQSS